jgi:hypothetical protein
VTRHVLDVLLLSEASPEPFYGVLGVPDTSPLARESDPRRAEPKLDARTHLTDLKSLGALLLFRPMARARAGDGSRLAADGVRSHLARIERAD